MQLQFLAAVNCLLLSSGTTAYSELALNFCIPIFCAVQPFYEQIRPLCTEWSMKPTGGKKQQARSSSLYFVKHGTNIWGTIIEEVTVS